MVKSYRVVVGGFMDYIVSFLGHVIVIVISRPRSLTIGSLWYHGQAICVSQRLTLSTASLVLFLIWEWRIKRQI